MCGKQHVQEENQSNSREGHVGSQQTYSVMCVWAVHSCLFATQSLLHFLSFPQLFSQAHKAFILGWNLRKYCAVPLCVSILCYSSVEEVRLIRIWALREPPRGVLTGSHNGRCESRRKTFIFMPKAGRGLRNHDENELPAQWVVIARLREEGNIKNRGWFQQQM